MRRFFLFCFVSYFLVSTFLTWPLIFNLNTTFFGDFGDSRGAAWWLWAKLNGYLDFPTNALLAAPFGEASVANFRQPIYETLLFLLGKASNEIVAINLFVIFAFVLSACSMACCLFFLLKSPFASFVGGLIFGFSPVAVAHAAAGHYAFAFNVFIPLFFLSLVYNRRVRNIHSSLAVALSFSLIALTALYIGYFSILVGLLFFCFDFFSSQRLERRALIFNYLVCGVLSALIILPFQFTVIYQLLTLSRDALSSHGAVRSLSELTIYSSRPWDYLLPPIDHAIWSDIAYGFRRENLHGSNLFEQTLYLGVIPIFLFLAGFVFFREQRSLLVQKKYYIFCVFGVLWSLFLSLPPDIAVNNTRLYTLSPFLYQLAPMFRVYSRFGIYVNFFLAAASAVVISTWYEKVTRPLFFLTFFVLITVCILDFWSIPSHFSLPIQPSPPVVEWLRKLPEGDLVAEYPMMQSDEASYYTYLFWQRLHKKRLVNGASRANAQAWSLYEQIKDLSQSETVRILQKIGVKYIVVHKQMYEDGQIPTPLKRYFPRFTARLKYNDGVAQTPSYPYKLVQSFGSDLVFQMVSDQALEPTGVKK